MTDFTGQALVFIGSSLILVPIFQRLGFGSVLGYLFAGIMVGPHGFKLIADSEAVVHFAELGVVFLLFIIGLEMQPRKLWSLRHHLLRLGALQVGVSTLIFALAGYLLGWPWITAGVLGFGLSLSSTAFAVQSLTEKNQFNTEFGHSSFSILLTQDLLAIPALAIIPALGVAAAADDGYGPQKAWLALAFIALLIGSSRYLMRPAFRLIATVRSREMFTAATLFVVLGVAAAMHAIGLSAALGTFIAGVLLSDSEYRHELETDIEPFKSLLMGLFFIGVGMTVNLSVFFDHALMIVAATLGYMAVKAAVIYAVSRLFKLRHENAKLTALTVAQGGEFAFVIFAIAARSALATPELLDKLTVMITLSMAINPLLTLANDRLTKMKPKGEPQYDQIKDESPQVIIAGFGRFGQIFGRVLRAQGIPFVAIDHDSNQIELVRRFGNKVYYGDASRQDLLETAGAARAKYLVIAVDSVDMSLAIAKTARSHFANLKIFARARNRGHAFDLLDLGIVNIKRETFDSSVNFVRDLLVDMGMSADRARVLIEKFKDHDEHMLQEQFKVRSDDKMVISVSQQANLQLAQVLSADEQQRH